MPAGMIFTNARLIFSDRIADGFMLRVADGKIIAIGENLIASPDDEVIDLRGNFLAPGFVDLHVHGAVGRDTMEGNAAAFRAICDYHASGGTTSVCLTTMAAPIPEIVRVIRAVEAAMPNIPQLRGAHVEGPFISPQKCGAQPSEFVLEAEEKFVTQIFAQPEAIRRVTLAPEIGGGIELLARLAQTRIAVSGGHSDATDEEAAVAFAHGMRQVTHTFNCMSSMQKRNGLRRAGLLEFALSEPEIFCELIADGAHVSPTLMRMLYRAKGAEKICLVTDASAGAGLPDESHFSLGGKDCVVRNGACWRSDGAALAGSAARMIDLVRQMVEVVGVSISEAIRMATESPARAMDWKNKGILKEGCDADLVVLTPQLEIVQTFVAGKPRQASPKIQSR